MARTIEMVKPRIIQTPKLLRVAAYARVSMDKETMMHSLAAQVEHYSAMIQRNPGWVYAGVYADEPTTGTKANRPQFQRMLEDARAKKLDMIIVKSISRFARNTVDLLQTIRELKDIGVDIFFEEQNIHSLSSDGELLITILASYAQEESRSVSENCKWHYIKAFRNGEVVNLHNTYGYRSGDDGYEIVEEEAAVVRRIFNSYAAGETPTDIASALNEEGIPRRRSDQWTEAYVRWILRNEKYTGNSILQKYFVRDHISKIRFRNFGEKTRYYANETHPAIISEELFERVQAKMNAICKRANSHREEHIQHTVLSGAIKCKACGKSFCRKKSRYETAWVCRTFSEKGKAVCASKKIPEDILKQKAAEVMGITEFDDDEFKKQIDHILIPGPNMLIFVMQDGTTKQRQWKDKSRADSWTPEMRAKAAEKTRERERKKKEWQQEKR